VALTARDVIERLGLTPLPGEGGYFREVWRSGLEIPGAALPAAYAGPRAAGTAIYYLLTADTFSALHRLPGPEIFHFHVGDPVEMLQLRSDGSSEVIVIGADLERGMRPQVIVPGGTWQGCRLAAGGRFVLMGTTMSPGFDVADFELGVRDALIARWPSERARILALTAPAA
jgi:predicted cupin superfamily sugar epimerase